MQFVGVAWSGADAAFKDFIVRHGLTFPQISDSAGNVYLRFSIASQPALAIIDADGAVQTFLGALDETSLDNALTSITHC